MDEKSTKKKDMKEEAQADAADCEPILIVNCDTHNPCGVVHLYLSPCGHSCPCCLVELREIARKN